MPENESLPIEVGLEKAKVDIVNAVGDIGSKYSLPASWILMILENIVSESKLNAFRNVIVQYDISNPAANDRPVIPTPEPVSDRLPTQAPVKRDEEKTDGRDKKPAK
jgi:hypothetical protein